jgi:hypothetical protein
MPVGKRILRSRGRALEELFFLKQNNVLIENKRQLEKMERTLKTVSDISGITDDDLLRRLIELNIQLEVLATISIIPLVEVAWADGKIHKKEREVILKAAGDYGIGKNQIGHSLLEQWLQHQPPQGLLESWIIYIRGLCHLLSEADCKALKTALLRRARAVAEAAGGFLGLTSKVSLSEEDMLFLLERAFEQ